jgi:hypothetical protein
MPSKWLAVIYNSNLTCNDALRVAATGWTSTSKQPVAARAKLFLFPAAFAKPGSYRAGRWCAPTPRAYSNDGSSKLASSTLFASLFPGDRHHRFLENDDTLEAAQRIASHADSRTTKLYGCRGQKVPLEDLERILY